MAPFLRNSGAARALGDSNPERLATLRGEDRAESPAAQAGRDGRAGAGEAKSGGAYSKHSKDEERTVRARNGRRGQDGGEGCGYYGVDLAKFAGKIDSRGAVRSNAYMAIYGTILPAFPVLNVTRAD